MAWQHRLRWDQQSLKRDGLIRRLDDGRWELTPSGRKKILTVPKPLAA
jgi:restriction endonuclease Mrr